jgi:hypothetical protein
VCVGSLAPPPRLISPAAASRTAVAYHPPPDRLPFPATSVRTGTFVGAPRSSNSRTGGGSSPRLGSRALLQELASATKRPSGERSQGCCCYSCRCCCCCCCCCCCRCRRCCWIGCDLASWTPRPRATRFLACSVSLRRCLSRCPRDASRLMRKKQLMLRRRETTISPLGNPPAVRHPRSHPRALYYVCEKSKLNGSGKLRDWPSNASDIRARASACPSVSLSLCLCGCGGAWVRGCGCVRRVSRAAPTQTCDSDSREVWYARGCRAAERDEEGK